MPAANGTSARAYLSLNVHLAVLWRKRIMPSQPPGQPPMAPSKARVNSEMRCPDRPARHLSKPKTRKVAALTAASQPRAMESMSFKWLREAAGRVTGAINFFPAPSTGGAAAE